MRPRKQSSLDGAQVADLANILAMRIAIIHPYPAKVGLEQNGSAIIYRDRVLGTLLQGFGHSVRGLRTTDGPGGVVVSPDTYLEWTYYPLDQGERGAPRSRVTSRALTEDLAVWSPDFLVIKGAGTAIGVELAHRFDTPMATIIGGNYADNVLARSVVVMTETPEQERFLRPRIGADRLIRLPKLVSRIFLPGPFKSDHEIDLVVVSKFETHKNHQALKLLLDHDLSIVFVGDGSLRQDFERYARTRRASVVFTDYVPAEDVAGILKRSRLLVHPSRSEGFPRVVVEAMASGTPAVCLDGVVGWPLVDGQNSLLVTESELTHSIMGVLGDPQLLTKLRQGALQTFHQEFSISSLRQVVDTLNQKILEAVGRFTGHESWHYRAAVMRYALIDSP